MFMRRPNLDNLPALPPLPPGHELRQAGAEDAAAIAAAMASAFGPEWTVARVREALLEAPDVAETFVVTAEGTVVATASARLMPDVYPGSGYLHWVGAHTEHRGKRLGVIVSLAVLHYFREMGCRDAVLETDPHRLPAITVYLRLGFVPEPVAPGEDALWREILAALANEDVSATHRAAPPISSFRACRGISAQPSTEHRDSSTGSE